MTKVIKETFLASLCIILTATAMAEETPRLFMAKKGNHISFFLPLSHETSAIERDNYLATVIEPVFRRASIVYDESAHKSHIYAMAALPCESQTNLPHATKSKLKKKFDEQQKFDKYVFPAPEILVQPEFAYFMLLRFGPVEIDQTLFKPSQLVVNHGQISTVLAEKYDTERTSIETMEDFRRIYCDLSNDEKELAIEKLLGLLAGPLEFNVEPEASQIYKRVLFSAIQTLKTSSKNTEKKPMTQDYSLLEKAYDKFFMSSRNKLWLKKIKAASQVEGVPFYGLGAAHFSSNVDGPGLFTLLKENGFSVSLIKSLNDLPPEFLRRTPKEILRKEIKK